MQNQAFLQETKQHKCELVFVPLLSDEQKKAAEDKGIELEMLTLLQHRQFLISLWIRKFQEVLPIS